MTDAYLDLGVSALLKDRLVDEAEAKGVTLNEVAVAYLCSAMGLDLAQGMTKRRMGRPPRRSGDKKRPKAKAD
jgi:hypothetical protein